MNKRWHINSRSAARREEFLKTVLDDMISESGETQDTRPLARRMVAQYYRHRLWREVVLMPVVVLSVLALIGFVIMLIASVARGH